MRQLDLDKNAVAWRKSSDTEKGVRVNMGLVTKTGVGPGLKRSVMRIVVLPLRLLTVLSYCFGRLSLVFRWLFSSREHTNFTYDLTDLNLRYMARFLAVVCGCKPSDMEKYIREILSDDQLREHIALRTKNSDRSYLADDDPRYARRVGWYALVRATRPRVVVETGVDKGLGSCILTAALAKNSEEGHPGRYYGTDINPKAGYLLDGRYASFGKILYGDSIESLSELETKIDLFINDSDHSTDYEMAEFETIESKLTEHAMVIGDNSHFSDKLINFAERTGRDFLYFQEQPENHWYPGGGIGVAYRGTNDHL